jgi:hypothetical protein
MPDIGLHAAQTGAQDGSEEVRRAVLAFHKTDSRSDAGLWPSRSGQFKRRWIRSPHVAHFCSPSRLTCAPLSGTRPRRICSHSTESGTGRKSHGRGPRPSVAPTPMPCGDAWGGVPSEIGTRVGRPAPSSGSLPWMGIDVVELGPHVGERTGRIGIQGPSANARSPSRR